MILSSDLTLLNINMSKNSFNIIKYKYVKEFYFWVIFLLKSLYYQ